MITRNINLFGKDYNMFAESCCSQTDKRTLYLSLTGKCNAKCSFCSANSLDPINTDLEFIKETITELVNKGAIDKISITGGETLLYPKLKELLDFLDILDIEHYAITTNGILLQNMMPILENSKIKYINISRHHYDDYTNRYIFRNLKVPSYNTLKKIIKKSKKEFRLNCTLTEEFNSLSYIKYYIKHAKYIGVKNVLFRDNYNEISGLDKENHISDYIQSLDNNIIKISNKCKCLSYYDGDTKIEYRLVDVKKEHDSEIKGEIIRNFVLSNNTLYGGWSADSIIINKKI